MVFQPGQSGNPAGRTPGTRNKLNLLLQKLLEGDNQEAIANKAIELARNGTLPALRMCMNQIAPARKGHPVVCELPILKKPSDCVAALAAITNGVAAGQLTPAEGADLAKLVDFVVRALEAHDLEERLSKFERGEND
jgi:hypothetical protein